MITIQNKADCTKCRNNPVVFQPSIEKETEWICCDKYRIVPIPIIKGGARCKEFKESETAIITK
jgi:hypothetical protein